MFGIREVGFEFLDLLLPPIFGGSVLLCSPGEGSDEFGLSTKDVSAVDSSWGLKKGKESKEVSEHENKRRESERNSHPRASSYT